MPLLIENVLCTPEDQRPNFDGAFTPIMQRYLIRFTSAPFTSFCLAKFGWAPFADLRVLCLAMKQAKDKIANKGWVKMTVPL